MTNKTLNQLDSGDWFLIIGTTFAGIGLALLGNAIYQTLSQTELQKKLNRR